MGEVCLKPAQDLPKCPLHRRAYRIRDKAADDRHADGERGLPQEMDRVSAEGVELMSSARAEEPLGVAVEDRGELPVVEAVLRLLHVLNVNGRDRQAHRAEEHRAHRQTTENHCNLLGHTRSL